MLDLTPRQLAIEYRMLYSVYEENDSTDVEIRAFHGGRPSRGGTFLNWGCGAWAQSIARLRDEGYDVWGFEPFAPSDHPFIVNHRGSLSAKFDIIFSNNVIEHVQDPVQALQEMAEHLSSNGVMVHASPCFELRYMDTRFHLFFYLGESFDRIAALAGLNIAEMVHDGEYIHAVLHRVPLEGGTANSLT